MKLLSLLTLVAVAFSSSVCIAQRVQVTGGQASGSLDPVALEAAGLIISSFSPDVTFLPGGEPVFAINGRNHPTRPTTFEYEVGTLTPTTGVARLIGSIFFLAGGPIAEIGNFEIGFDLGRVAGVNSGFFP